MSLATLPSPGPCFAIEAREVFDGERFLGSRRVEIRHGRVSGVLQTGCILEPETVVQLPEGMILAPGFIDIQVNGGGGALLNELPSPSTIRRISEAHRRFGTTGMLPTLITDHPAKLRHLLAGAAEGLTIPGVLGYHLEGPNLNPARKGIHPSEHIRRLAKEDFTALQALARLGPTLVTLAPECISLESIAALTASGLRLAAGHSDATAAQIQAAADHGLTGVTHLFNAMSQMTPREPGVVGAAMADPRLFASMICDGLHVTPLNLAIAMSAMGPDRLMLVTDAMPTAGGECAFFMLHGRQISLKDGRLTDAEGTLAGAHLTMIQAIKNATSMMGARLEDALVMACRTPARFLGLGNELGAIATGYRADLVAFTRDFHVERTWIAGMEDLNSMN